MLTINELVETVEEGLKMPLNYFISSNKRIFIVYLFSSFVIAYFVFRRLKNQVSFFSFLFAKKVWWSESARTDYVFLFFNGLFKVFFIAPFFVWSAYLTLYFSDFCFRFFGEHKLHFDEVEIMIYYTLVLFFVKDFFSFFIHYLAHKIPFLWAFHKVHHSATVLNPITQYRIHPVELFINNIKGFFVIGLVTGVFNYLYAGQLNVLMVLGVNVFNFLFLFIGSNLRHSHIKLSYPSFLEKIFISPYQHQIHHGKDACNHDKNMGSVLAIWDWMFKTLKLSGTKKTLSFGIGFKEQGRYSGFIQNLFNPFLDFFRKKG